MNDDDLEELLAARSRMLRPGPGWLHRIAHVFADEPLAPVGWPANLDWGFKMTGDDADSAPALGEGEGKLIRLSDYLRKITPQPSFMPNLDFTEDDIAIEALRRAHQRMNKPMSTPESIRDGEEFMKELRLAASSALRRRVESGELVSLEDFQARSQLTAEQIDRAVSDGRLLAIVDEEGVSYYPIFYANPRYDRHEIEEVTKKLAGLHPTVKYHFFISKAFSLHGKTPLEALEEGRLDDVLRAARSCVER
jgi:hypothetical protein